MPDSVSNFKAELVVEKQHTKRKMGKKIEAPRLRTALHIVQGALAKALDEDLPLLGATGAICGLRLRQERVCVGRASCRR